MIISSNLLLVKNTRYVRCPDYRCKFCGQLALDWQLRGYKFRIFHKHSNLSSHEKPWFSNCLIEVIIHSLFDFQINKTETVLILANNLLHFLLFNYLILVQCVRMYFCKCFLFWAKNIGTWLYFSCFFCIPSKSYSSINASYVISEG